MAGVEEGGKLSRSIHKLKLFNTVLTVLPVPGFKFLTREVR